MEELRGLGFKLGWMIDTKPILEADEKVDKMDKSVKKLEKDQVRSSKSIGLGFSSIGTGIKKVAGLVGAAGMGFGLFKLGEDAIEAGDRTYVLSQRMGLTAKEASGLNRILKLTDTDTKPFISSMMRLDKAIETVGKNGNTTTKTLSAFGVHLVDSKGKLLPMTEQLGVLASQYRKAEEAGRGDAFATSIFGAKAQQMLPLLEDYTEAKEAASRVKGIGIDPKAAHEASVNLKVLKMETSQVGMTLSNAMMPIVQSVLPPLIMGFTNLAGFINKHQKDVKAFTNEFTGLATKIGSGVVPIIKNDLIPMIKGIIDNSRIAVPIIAGLGAGFGTLMVIGKINMLYKAWQEGTTAMTVAQAALNIVMDANPLGLVALGVGALVTGAGLLITHWKEVTTVMSNVWRSIKNSFATGVNWVINKLNWVIGKVDGLHLPGVHFNMIEHVKLDYDIGKPDTKSFTGLQALNQGIGNKIINPPITSPKGILAKQDNGASNGSKTPKVLPAAGAVSKGIMPRFAEGGFASKPSIFGEAGPEVAIPIKPGNKRSIGLLSQAADFLGLGTKTASRNPESSPSFRPVNIQNQIIMPEARPSGQNITRTSMKPEFHQHTVIQVMGGENAEDTGKKIMKVLEEQFGSMAEKYFEFMLSQTPAVAER